MMTCIILEDEIPAQNILKNFISRVPSIQLLATFQTATAASSFLNSTEIDFILLDINLPDIQGIDFIKSVNNPPKIIITTAYPNYAVASFELETITDYLVKPFSYDRFLKSIRKVETSIQTTSYKHNYIFLNIDKTLHKVRINDILFITSDRNYVTFITTSKKYVLLDTLKEWKSKLSDDFVQIHRSYLINLNYIEKIQGNVLFISNHKLPIGRTYKSNFLKSFQFKKNSF